MDTYKTLTLTPVQSLILSDEIVLNMPENFYETLKPKQIDGFIRRGYLEGSKVSRVGLIFEENSKTYFFRLSGIALRQVENYAEKLGCRKVAAADILFWTGYLSGLNLDYQTLPEQIDYVAEPELEPARDGNRGRPATGQNVRKELNLPLSLVQQLNDYGAKPSKFMGLVFDSYQSQGGRLGSGLLDNKTKVMQLALTYPQWDLLETISSHYGTTLSQSLMMVYSGSKYFVRD